MGIIGGKFGLPIDWVEYDQPPSFLSGKPILFFNARSAILWIISELEPEHIWLPSYLCASILSAVKPTSARVQFYETNKLQKLKDIRFIKKVKRGDVFLYIDYFGFPFLKEEPSALIAEKAFVIRDCSQSLFFDPSKSSADFTLFSPRKFLGVPDGGILHIKQGTELELPVLKEPPFESYFRLLGGSIMRREFDLHTGNRIWHQILSDGENLNKPGNFRMSDVSQMLLMKAFDYAYIQSQRRTNYAILLKRLEGIALFPDLLDNVVPLGFPVALKRRDLIQHELFKQEIYPPIHWYINGLVPEGFTESHELSETILTLPCDQRYQASDMERIAELLLGLIK